ncbi:uncharacterized protein Dwil_GK24567 [Drosophila willistoni]|uniref:Globin domain-containing protein n=1 Tax=Drosophila willistoni TaxID=7260 RepID=B4N0F0_DROWI|nr:uncharacterized protein LOC6644120 [Drosophila willistoni]EDW77563.1 uncharacterized protein Dwil_GK24567 [Drosophila willistoni]
MEESGLNADRDDHIPEIHSLPIYPKPLATRDVSHKVDENGFSITEKAALRNAWRFVEPFVRRYGKDNFYTFLTTNDHLINVFRYYNTIQLGKLHSHALTMMKLLTRLIQNIDNNIEFRLALEENLPRHMKAGVEKHYMRMLANAIKDYLLACPQLCNHNSPTLTRAMERLVTIVGEHAHTEEVRKRAMSFAYMSWQRGSEVGDMYNTKRSTVFLTPDK